MADEKLPTPRDAELPTHIVKEHHPEGDSEVIGQQPEQPGEQNSKGDGKTEKEDQGSIRDFAVRLQPMCEISISLTMLQRIFRFADRLDQCLFTIAFLTSIASGTALPLMTIIFGQFTTKFNDFVNGDNSGETFKSDVDQFVLWFVYLFVGRFAIVYIANICVSIAAIRTTRAVRKAFLESTLRQEVWHFDKQNTGSISTQVTTNGNRINQGIAEKLAAMVQGIALFFSSFIVALAVQWKLALIVMSIVSHPYRSPSRRQLQFNMDFLLQC